MVVPVAGAPPTPSLRPRTTTWTTLPGILTGVAALITAISTILGVGITTGKIHLSGASSSPTPSALSSPNPNVLFHDDFSHPANGWHRGPVTMAPATTTMSPGPDAGSVVGTADYVNDAYRIDVTQPNMHIFEGHDVVFSDTIIDVDDTKVDGSNNNGFGIWCRNKLIENSVPTSGYRSLINSNAYYTMQKSDNGEGWYPLVENKD